jgi:16S rRNA G1207 methylase RsmC
MLGGYHNFEADRLAAKKVLEIMPDARLGAHAARAFLRRVVNFLVKEKGVDQILDLGSGIPTVGNVHQVAQEANPAARVVYVDIDPVAVAHSLAMLKDNPNAIAIQADVRQPDTILNHPEVKGLLDFGRPMGVLFL